MNIGLFLPNWVGDLTMATPALSALRSHYVDARVVAVIRPQLVDVLAGTNVVDEYFTYDPRSKFKSERSLALVQRLRNAQLDMIVLFTNSWRTAALAWASGAPRRIGFVRNARGWMLTDRLQQRRDGRRWLPTPVVDDYGRLVEAAGCHVASKRLVLATTSLDERAADLALARLGVGPRFVTINCSGAFGAAKLWPADYFAALARRIVTRHGRHVLALCGPNERDTARAIVRRAGDPRVVSLADEHLSLGLTKACVRRSELLVTTDSGPRHFAAAFDVPVITLFGPTHIAWSETYYPRAIHLQKKMPCGPCQQRECPLGHHRCMRELGVDEVYRVVCQQLGAPCTTQAA